MVYTFIRSICVHTNRNTDSVFHCLVQARFVFRKNKRLAITKQWDANVLVLWPCANVSAAYIKNRFAVPTHFMKLKCVTPTEVSATFASWAVKTDRSWYAYLIRTFLPLQNWSATMYKTAAIIEMSEWAFYPNHKHRLKYSTERIRLYQINSYMGHSFYYRIGFISCCQMSRFWSMYGIS